CVRDDYGNGFDYW
nr:immunoglobulin heavy chain junction region [Macaca mulatta]